MRTKGWQKVFAFTLKEHIKTKSFIISTIIMAVLVAAIFVLANILPAALVGGNSGEGEESPIKDIFGYEKIYIADETGIITDADIAELAAGGLKAERTDKTADDIIAQIAKAEGAQAAIVYTADKNSDGKTVSYTAKTFYSPSGKDRSTALSSTMMQFLKECNVKRLGIDFDAFNEASMPINTKTVEAGQEELNVFSSMIHYVLPMVLSMALFLIIFSYGNTVAQSIAIEKTSRVMELLLTSVRPLAVVIGKVLAMGVVSFGQILLIIVVGAASVLASSPFGVIGQISPLLSNPEMLSGGLSDAAAAGVNLDQFSLAQAINSVVEKFTAVNIILIGLAFLIGFLFYALLAALVGASVSRMEDLQAAMQPYSLIGVVGFFLAYYPIIFNTSAIESGSAEISSVQMFSYYFPISSPFSIPGAVILGQLDTVQSAIAVGVLVVFTVLVAMLVSRVYEAIILHNGSRLKIGDILKMAQNK